MILKSKEQKEQNEWLSVSVMGYDRPGIVAAVAKVLFDNVCNIESLSQTVLMGQFAMIVVAAPLAGSSADTLRAGLEALAARMKLAIHVRTLNPTEHQTFDAGNAEPFVITVRGEDRPGLVYAITTILAEQGVNITRLGAEVVPVNQQLDYIQIYEVDIPRDTDFSRIQKVLREKGAAVGVSVDMQHRNIFRAINQI
jgi:glycine cleavage system transcriptional repressor